MRNFISIVESAELPAMIVVDQSGKVEISRISFTDYLKKHNIPHVGSIVDSGNVWCNVNFEYGTNVYWKTIKPIQLTALSAALQDINVNPSLPCSVHALGQEIQTTVGKLSSVKPPVPQKIKKKKPPSKILLAAENIGVEIIAEDAEGQKLTRVVWEKTPTLKTNSLSTVSLADNDKIYPGIYALHVTNDPEFWFHQLIDDYGNDTTAYLVEIKAIRGDVIVEDVQYTMPQEMGEKADSAILLTSRSILREGKDFNYIETFHDNRFDDSTE